MKKLTGFAFLLCLITTPVSACSNEGLVFASAETASGVMVAYQTFLRQAYAEIGCQVSAKTFPTVRAYVQADIDRVDGIISASKRILDLYDNLVIVPVPLRQIYLTAFSIKKNFPVKGPESLRPYRIGIHRGYLISDEMTRGMDRQIVDSYEALLTILKIGRVDVVLALKRETGRFLSAHTGFGNVKALEPPVYTFNLYHCLNKKHAALVGRITPVLEKLISDGVLENLLIHYNP